VEDEYLTEREQVERLRGMIKENLPGFGVALLIAAAILWGWPQFKSWQLRQSSAANEKYVSALDALNRGDKTTATRLADQLKADYARTPYADLASLAIARFDVDTNALEEAAGRLEALAQNSRDQELRVVARLRLARVERAQGKPDLALKTLADPPEGAAPAFADVRGDVLQDKGDRDGAIAAWREALAAKTPGVVNRELIELKVAALGAPAAPGPAAGAPAAAAPATAPAASGAKP